MRIIGGKYRSRVLAEFAGTDVRPTADRVKESLFNILGVRTIGARVLDVFCGSGALGIECISRGAKECVFNDVRKESVALLKKNLQKLGVGSEAKTYNLDFRALLSSVGGEFDLIFLDPPYKENFAFEGLEIIAKRKLLASGGVAVSERDRPFDGEISGLEQFDERKYGKTYLTFFKVKGDE